MGEVLVEVVNDVVVSLMLVELWLGEVKEMDDGD